MLCNAKAGVRDANTQKPVICFPAFDRDRTAVAIVFYGIGQEVDQRLLETHLVSANKHTRTLAELIGNYDVSRLSKRKRHLDAFGDNRVGLKIFDIKGKLVRLDFRQIKNLVNELEKMVAAEKDAINVLVLIEG